MPPGTPRAGTTEWRGGTQGFLWGPPTQIIPELPPVMGLGACPRPWGHALAQAMGKRAVPDIQPPLLPASTLAGLVSGWWLPHGSGRPLWWAGGSPRALLPALPVPLARTPLPGRWAWGQEIPSDKGAWVRESRARGSQLSTAEVGAMRWLGAPRNPLLHSCPIPPHTSLLAEVRTRTQLSVGLGHSCRGWAQVPRGGFHLHSRFTGMGTEWKRAREVSDACLQQPGRPRRCR